MHTLNKIKNYVLILTVCLLTGNVFAQETGGQEVTGTINDASTGLPLSGINVSVPGFSSTATNDSGVFTIKVPDNKATLEIYGKDFQRKELPLKGKNSVSVKLMEESYNSVYNLTTLPYSRKTKNSIVYSSASANSSWTNPAESPESIVQGKVAGLRTIYRSGTPGIGANLFLRGYSSIYATNQPLIIIDGVIYDNQDYSPSQISGYTPNPLSHIDVKDIDNITVIKDAVSIYGSKAANGVILINTVHAKEAATRVDVYVHGGMNFTPKKIPVMNASEFRSYLTEQLRGKGLSDGEIQSLPYMTNDVTSNEYLKYNNDIDWQDEVYKRSVNQNYYLRVAGGDEIAKYGLSVGYTKDNGIIKKTDFSRYTMRFNADVLATSRLSIHGNLGFTYGEHNLKNDGISPKTSPVYLSLVKSPFFTPKILAADGTPTQNLEDVDSLHISNPAAIINTMEATNRAYRFIGSAKLNYKITDFINFSTLLGVSFDKNDENVFIPGHGIVADTLLTTIAVNTVKSNIQRLSSVYNDNRLNFSKTFNKDHYISVDLGLRYNTNNYRDDIALTNNTPNDALKFLSSGNSYLDRAAGSIGTWKWLSYYAGIDYSYVSKYFLSVNVSADGSSRFGSEAKGISLFSKKFGVFPSIGAAWLVSSENFMSGIEPLDLLKIRVSYGLTGNDDIGNYGDTKYYSSQRFIGYVGLVNGNIPNTGIQWETNKKTNAGLDLALFNERLQLNADYFLNKTENMLVLSPIDKVSGFSYAMTNDGTMENKGFEINISARIVNKTLKWDAGVGIAQYKNKITKLPLNSFITDIAGASILSETGKSIGLFYGYKTQGVYSSDEEATLSGLTTPDGAGNQVAFRGGDIRFEDVNGDGIINASDRQVIGNANPEFTGMFNNRISWKRLTFDFLFTFSYRNDVYNQLRHETESMSGLENQSTAVLNRWRGDGQITDVPRAAWGDPMGNARFSDRWIEDGSYIKLKTISLSYDLPVKKGFFKNGMIYIAGNNLITFTNYTGFDPEFSMSSSCLAQGIDIGLTPQFKSVFVGLKIGL
jgi:TonB-linked SusC/RagA family outer membrane protein